MKSILRLFYFFIYVLSFISFICTTLLAQAPDTLWTKRYGWDDHEWGYSVQQTSDSGYIIVGSRWSAATSSADVWLIKSDTNGDTMWTNTFGGGENEYGYSVQQTKDGGYVITGSTTINGFGTEDILLIKTDSFGDTIWTKKFGDSSSDIAYSVQQTLDSGYIITGFTKSHISFSSADVLLIKTDSFGDTIWTKTFGGSNADIGSCVKKTTDGGYIITGMTLSFGTGHGDVWLIKTDSVGNPQWTKTVGGNTAHQGYYVQQTSDQGYIIAGYKKYGLEPGSYNALLIKTDSSGDAIWTKIIGDSTTPGKFKSVHQTSDGGYIMVGDISFNDKADVLLVKVNTSGDILWTKTLGGNDYDFGESVQQTTDSGYIIVGYTESFGTGYYDLWLIKTEPDPSSAIEIDFTKFPEEITLSQNYPNPFNPSTKIKFELPKPETVKIEVFNIIGQKIETLLNKPMPAGYHEVEFSGQNLSSGIYLYKIETGAWKDVKKMILLQ